LRQSSIIVYWLNPTNFRVKEGVGVDHCTVDEERGKKPTSVYILSLLGKRLLEQVLANIACIAILQAISHYLTVGL